LELRRELRVSHDIAPAAVNPPSRGGQVFELLGRHGLDSIVAFGGAGDKTALDLLTDAARISRALPPAFESSQALLVFERDRYAMAAAFLGALDRGHSVALPPSGRRDAVLAMNDLPETAIVIHDTDAGLPISIAGLIDSNNREEDDPRPLLSPIVPHAGVIATVFTSGTTGAMTKWPKTRAELLGEAQALGELFHVKPGDKIVGTVPPGHIYGLLFTIVLPLMRGASFSRDTPLHSESVARCVRQNVANILVTTPVQLRSLAALPAGSLAGLERVFSSTGPLPDSVARSFSERFQLPVTEILGSTETGGIATRVREAGESMPWRPFDGVRVAMNAEGRLVVDSPFVHGDLPRPFETADLIDMNADGTFEHLGRSDGIVKIGGRRISITEVEECLRQEPDVNDVAVVAVPVEGGRGHQLLAAVVPTGGRETEDGTPEKLIAVLREALKKDFEPSCLPRRIICVAGIPRDANGKTPRDRLLRLFDLQPNGKPINWKLDWGEASVLRDAESESLEISARIPEDYAWFEGHFEGFPLLAGAVQLKELILPTVARAFPELGVVTSMSRIKFNGRIGPGDKVTVRVARKQQPGRIRFEIRKENGICAVGMLSLAEGREG
jgi:acyl-coenzyme A synthetase/AMP-(fatty) acid ligase